MMLLTVTRAEIDVTHSTVRWGWAVFNADTLFNTVLVCALLLIFALVLRLQLHSGVPSPLQNATEAVVEFIGGLVQTSMAGRGINLAPLAITLFVFLLIANWIGLIPKLKSPTNDWNTTLSLALMTFLLVQFYSIRKRGLGGFLKHFFLQPPYFPLSVIDELAKPVTLSFRLYFNIFVGELLLALIVILIPPWISWLPGAIWTLFSLFVGVVQAFIFTILTVSYIAVATEVAQEH